MTINITIPPKYDGILLREYLQQVLQYSRRHIIRLKTTNNGILVNGTACTVRTVLHAGDMLCLTFDQRPTTVIPTKGDLDIIYQDSYIYIVDKPYGIPTHPDREHVHSSLGNIIIYHYGGDRGAPLHIATRLDKTTSGLVLGAKDSLTADKLSLMLQQHNINKTYYALVDGVILHGGTIDAPLYRDDTTNSTIVDIRGKSAHTSYYPVSHHQHCTLVRLLPTTGRTHQLRAHMAHIGHPIVGDTLYGGTPHHRIMLHMHQLQLTHPITQQQIVVSSQLSLMLDDTLLV